LNISDSKYIERAGYVSRYTHERTVARQDAAWAPNSAEAKEWLRHVAEDLPVFIPFLQRKCGLDFAGRILEIGAGGAWFSAELSKLPKVVEITATDLSPRQLKEEAPRVFKLLKAHAAKITRMPADCHKLNFPENHFDWVVCSGVLHHTANIVQVLREVKRVLKPGGHFVAIREPVWPLVKIKTRKERLARLAATGVNEGLFTLAAYREYFKQAALPLEVKRVNLARGFKYYVNEVINGLTHARYAFVARKPGAKPKSTPSISKSVRRGLRGMSG
jgi:ubiquinone/menaquinone biosynthesis C-methylase UbiE